MSTAFRVRGFAPESDWQWAFADEPTRRDFWREVVRLVKIAKQRELAAGLDRFGKPLIPITEYTRRHRKSAMGIPDPNGPVFQPAHDESRTVAWFDGRAFADHAEFFWRNGWGRILKLHATGRARGGKVRDVLGLSPKNQRWVETQANAWWRAWKDRQRIQQHIEAFTAPAFAGRKRPAPPRKIRVIGRTDTENMTFGVGGGEARAKASIEAGYHTGYFEIGARRPPGPFRAPRATPRIPRTPKRVAARSAR